jgi:hypothetical protein
MIDARLKEVFTRLGIKTLVETGTDMGETVAEVATWFAEASPEFGTIEGFVETGARSYNAWNEPIRYPCFRACGDSAYKIFSVDCDEESYRNAKRNFASNPNIVLVNESSEVFLRRIIGQLRDTSPDGVFFFLDAHWGPSWPIRDELATIAGMERFIVAIDDFFVPGRSDIRKARGEFGFDFYRRRILSWGYIHDCFAPGSVRVFYPETPNRDRRGWCLLTRGYSAADLDFLGRLGLVEMSADDPRHLGVLQPEWSTYLDLRILLRLFFPLEWLRRAFRAVESLRSAARFAAVPRTPFFERKHT